MFESWKRTHTWETCKLNRGKFGSFLSHFVRESESIVLNLDAPWGAGKTEFLKRLYVDLDSHSHPVIYINAWESDFSKNPLSVITSELLTQLSQSFINEDPDFKEKLYPLFGKALKYSSLAVNLLKYSGETDTAQSVEEAAAIASTIPQTVESICDINTSNRELMVSIQGAHQAQIKAMKEVKEQLSALVAMSEILESKKLPVVVLVDELDRCRPNYAIEFLEVIKHFFEANNFVFICASDTKQLSESIKTIYGNSFDSSHYLRRFFGRKVLLPPPDIHHYLAEIGIPEPIENSTLSLTPDLDGLGELDIIFSEILLDIYQNSSYKLELRDIDQILTKYRACLSSASCADTKVYLNAVVLFYSIAEEHVGKPYTFDKSGVSVKSKVTIEGKPVSNFINVQFSLCSVVETESVKWQNGRIKDVTYLSPIRVLRGFTYIPDGYNNASCRALCKSYSKSLLHWEEQDAKYYLKEDIRNLVELASYIE
ncbi:MULTISPECIES: KAP family P-loop NTPase fold protein [unclassified Alteromonas]|uniref:KAP family P-loop NTPase fold protein n=1 Tax=unclassified Alteromonas TaxID=2614992 RepID=UPI00068E72A7|nr:MULTISPECIES: P-loop NTPase fold protein [unclassified Alteromonas]